MFQYANISVQSAFETIYKKIQDKLIERIATWIIAILTPFLAILISHLWTGSSKLTVSENLKKLCVRAERIKARLQDVDQNRHIVDQSVLLWLSELRSIAFEIENLDDEFNTRSKLWSKLWSVSTFFSYNRYYKCTQKRINESHHKFDELYKDRKQQMLHKVDGAHFIRSTFSQTSSLSESGSLQGHFQQLRGRGPERKTVLGLLLNPSGNSNYFSVISINGVGGIGKTALAQSVFRDESVTKCFHHSVWVSLSSHSDPVKTLQKIIKDITQTEYNFSTLDTLQTTLHKLVTGKKILLVLDDLWTDNPSFWDRIRDPLRSANLESKILVTTRSQVASQNIGTSESVALPSLIANSLWDIIKDEAFPQASENPLVPENLKNIGLKIARKCDGSPFVAKLLGKALCNCSAETQWNNLLDDMPDHQVLENTIPSLKVSYDALPFYLKRCFVYCAIFPKDYKFDRDDLVKLWVSEGLIDSKWVRASRVLEDIGREQFTSLLRCSFFQPSDGNSKRYVMPGVIHDLAQFVSKYECLRVDRSGIQHGEHERASYALLAGDQITADSIKHIYKRKLLRTFIVYNESRKLVEYPNPKELIRELKYLRSLDLSYMKLKKLPGSIKNLLLLRYLNLRGTLFEKLPDLICDLLNLQTLELGECCNLKKLPAELSRLVNMRHIGLGLNWEKWDGVDFDSMPPNLGTLTSLQTLSRFAVSKNGDSCIGELRDLDLRGELCVSKLENVRNGTEAKKARLNEKKRIKFLMLKGSSGKGFSEDVLESLKPNEMINSVHIEWFNGSTFPNWMEDISFRKLDTIRLSKCTKCVKLPRLGKLRHLETLYIQGLDNIVDLNDLRCEANGRIGFESLNVLHISDMPKLKRWFDVSNGRLNNLSELIISNCPKLESASYIQFPLPGLLNLVAERTNSAIIDWIRNLNSLTSLAIIKIPNLKEITESHLSSLSGLGRLKIEECGDLVSLARNRELEVLPSLKELEISNCEKLESFFDEGFPSRIKQLKLKCLNSLNSLPKNMNQLEALFVVEIHQLPNLKSMPKLPPNIYQSIEGCPHIGNTT